MRFMAGDPEVPILVRLCRNLLLTEAGLLLLVALFLLAARGVSGGTVTLDGGVGVGTEAALYLAVACVVVVVGINVGRLRGWARWTALLLELLLIAFLASEAVRGRGSNVVLFILAIAIIGLLLSPQANRGFAAASGGGDALDPRNVSVARKSDDGRAETDADRAPDLP